MDDQVSLDAHGISSALAVLQREQTAYLPTAREYARYRWFNICVFSLALLLLLVSVVLGTMSQQRMSDDAFNLLVGLLTLISLVPMLGTVVLGALNWRLIRKLYHHAKLRKRLKLGEYFARAFSAEAKTTLAGNLITFLAFIAGCLLILGAFFGAVAILIESPSVERIGAVGAGSMYLVMFLVGVSLVSFRYVRRGKDRLEVVLRLQTTLTAQAARGTEKEEVKLSTDDYDAIATMERQHIIRDRASSIASARKRAGGPEYLCQSSRQMHLAKSKLTPGTLVKVEGAIAELLVDPLHASAMASDPATHTSSIPVADTGLRIQYDVDATRHLVRLYDLQTEGGNSVSEGGHAHGLS